MKAGFPSVRAQTPSVALQPSGRGLFFESPAEGIDGCHSEEREGFSRGAGVVAIVTTKRTDRIDRGLCPNGKCEHRAYLHVGGYCVICRV